MNLGRWEQTRSQIRGWNYNLADHSTILFLYNLPYGPLSDIHSMKY
jgi:hypothetical protein